MKRLSILSLLLVGQLLTACATTTAPQPSAARSAGFMEQGREVVAPSGMAALCSDDASACPRVTGDPLRVAQPEPLTAERWALLDRVNREVNDQIRPASDKAIYGVDERWVDPLLNKVSNRDFARGDCEDYALAKRDALLAAGWPAESLFMAVGLHDRLGLHTVLVARTSRGDLVLDSRSPWIVGFNETPYLWIKRQVAADSLRWVGVWREAPTTLAALSTPINR
ncbi:transglutaminase-like cysteine peptidase [Caulobacter sp. LARHSG274]